MAPAALLSLPNGTAVAAAVAAPRIVVGYALTKKKVKSFLQPKLLLLARKKGISFISLDETRPVSEQGPFDIILHKITSKEWQQVLEVYHEAHPEVTVLDPPHAIEHLNNRQSMLEEVDYLNSSNFMLPSHCLLMEHLNLTSYPWHTTRHPCQCLILLLFSRNLWIMAGSSLRCTLLAKQYRLSAGFLFLGIYRLPRVSCAAATADHADLDTRIAELPPRPLLEKLSRELRGRLGLRLFNIDMIRELGTNDRYYLN